jgi:hypothetical protein
MNEPMNKLKDLLEGVSVMQILEYCGFTFVQDRNAFLIHSDSSGKTFYTFSDRGGYVRIFDQSNFSFIDKWTLLTSLVNLSSYQELSKDVDLIKSLETTCRLEYSNRIDAHTFLNSLAGLKKMSSRKFALADSPQFRNRVFETNHNLIAIPLFSLKDNRERSDRIVNILHLEGEKSTYFNNRRDGVTATNYDPENRFLVLSSNPTFWLNFLSTNYGPDYLLLLCHPEATTDVFQSVVLAMDRLTFSSILVPRPSTHNDKALLARIVEFFLNRVAEDLVFNIRFDGSEFRIEVFAIEGDEHLTFMKQVLRELNEIIWASFFGIQNGIVADQELSPVLSVIGGSVSIGSKDVFIIVFPGNELVATKLFSLIIQKFGIGDRLEILDVCA